MTFTYDICIVGGAGHIGLPLALVFCRKWKKVLIYDINKSTLEKIQSGFYPYMEIFGKEYLQDALRNNRLEISTDPSLIADSRVIVVTIGTPIDEFSNPMIRVVQELFDQLLPYYSEDQLIILRSTVYPGTTDWLHNYMSDHGKNPKLAYCPERVVQGHGIEEIQSLAQIVSGTSKEAVEEASNLFTQIAPDVVHLSPKEAEFAKLFTNAYRYIQFAAANQFYMIASSAGVNYNRVLKALKRNYPRSKDMPSAGFTAGPCLFKDTMQLCAFSNNQFSLGHSAMLVNEGMVFFITEELRTSYELEKMIVGLLGMAFKPDSDDARASLSYKLKKILKFKAKEVLTTDPYVKNDPEILPAELVIERCDILVLCAPHSIYRDLNFCEKPIIDVWGFLSSDNNVN